jgi:hypothetical protein
MTRLTRRTLFQTLATAVAGRAIAPKLLVGWTGAKNPFGAAARLGRAARRAEELQAARVFSPYSNRVTAPPLNAESLREAMAEFEHMRDYPVHTRLP